MAGFSSSFLNWNRRASALVARHLPQAREDLFSAYVQTVGGAMNMRPAPVMVADIGAGKQCPFAHLRPPGREVHIIGVDVASTELEGNRDID